jgi:seryl-tRNA synthetase
MSRRQLELSGYLRSFPHLLGVVSCMHGSESEIRNVVEKQDWISALAASDLVLAPAACYPVYPMAAARGYIPPDGLLFDVAAYCFRREASHEFDRLQAFRMREFVYLGTADQALEFRATWISRAEHLASLLHLPYEIVRASDPFFGRIGRLAAASQIEQDLKFELIVALQPESKPSACMSFNYHQDHFATSWGLQTASGSTAHTCCVAFGLDRLALALFVTHGLEVQSWPATVRKHLSL